MICQDIRATDSQLWHKSLAKASMVSAMGMLSSAGLKGQGVDSFKAKSFGNGLCLEISWATTGHTLFMFTCSIQLVMIRALKICRHVLSLRNEVAGQFLFLWYADLLGWGP